MGLLDRVAGALGQLATPSSQLSSVYAASAQRLLGEDSVPLSRFRGQVLVIVNVASE
jgi:hypothetical protein